MTGTWRVRAAVLAEQLLCECLVGWGEGFLVPAQSPSLAESGSDSTIRRRFLVRAPPPPLLRRSR